MTALLWLGTRAIVLLINWINGEVRLDPAWSERGVTPMLGLFILSHIPNRIFSGYTLADIPLDFVLLFGYGLLFTAVDLLSGNLFPAIGVHALLNRPTLITEAPFPVQALLFILLAALRRCTDHFSHRL